VLALAACAAALALAAPARATWSPPLLPTIATGLTGRDVQVRCLDGSEWQTLVAARGAQNGPGAVEPGGAAVDLRTPVCQVLLGFSVALPDGPKPRTRAGFAVADYARFLGRLSAQARGIADPAEAECSALLSVQTVLEQLGAEPRYARKLGGWLLDRAFRSPQAPALPPTCPVQPPA
jgi:hypothetical protein